MFSRFPTIYEAMKRGCSGDLYEVLEGRKTAREIRKDPSASKEDKQDAQDYLDDSDAVIIYRSFGGG